MENQKKKLRLEDIKVESFVTNFQRYPKTLEIKGRSDDDDGITWNQAFYCQSDGSGGSGNGTIIDTINDPRFGSIINASCEFGVCPGGTGRSNNHPDPNVYCS